jgi:two-component system, cell cycle sensor histidine kinase and response regulator CckA
MRKRIRINGKNMNAQPPNNQDMTVEALYASELRYRRLFETAQDGILILDAETGIVVDVNPFLVDLLGISRETILNERVWELGFFRDIAANKAKFAELKAREYVRYDDLPLKTVTGQSISVEFVSNVYLVDGRQVIQCNIRDIRARKRAEKELREAQSRAEWLARLPDENPSPVLRVSDDGTVLYHNPATMKLPGWTCKDGQALSQPLLPLIKEALRQGLPINMDIELDGRCYLISVIPVVNESYVNVYGQDITERKSAEEAMRDKERQNKFLADLLDQSNQPFAIGYPDGCLGIVNRAYARLVGYSKEELRTMKWEELTPSKWRNIENSKLKKLRRTGKPVRYEKEYIRKDGAVVPIELLTHLVTDEHSQPKLYYSFITDLTERISAKEAQLQSEERFRIALEATKDGIWDCDLKTNQAFHSPRWFEILGYTDNDPELPQVYESWESRIHPDDYDRVVSVVNNCIENGGRWDLEYQHRHKSGKYRWQSSRGQVVCDEWGKPVKMVGCISDITERKQAEETLRASEERFRRIFQHSGSGMAIVSSDLHFLQANDEFCKMLGYNESELLEKTLQDVTHPEDQRTTRALVEQVLAGEIEKLQLEKRYLRKDGTEVWGLVSAMLIRDAQNQPHYLVGQIQDLTERKRAEKDTKRLEAQYSQAQKMEVVGRLAGGVAHDFNNMLSIIIGHATMAMSQIDPASPLYEDFKSIATAGRRSAEITRQLLAFARKQTISPRVLDLNDTITGLLKMVKRLIREDIKLTWNPGKGLCKVRIDPSQIDQLLANLMINASDAIGGVGEIHIETINVVLDDAFCASHEGSTPGEYALLMISDNGAGMSAEVMEHIFEPFFTTKELGKGTGLGLATVYGIIKQNHGYIQVESKEAKGTIFRSYLPCSNSKTDQTQQVEKPMKAPGGNETILVVEDVLPILELLVRILERLGYSVLSASSPEQAIHLTEKRSENIHLLITDVVMPEMNGRDLADMLLALQPGMKRLYMSGYTSDVIADRGVLAEGVNFIHKPFDEDEIAVSIRNVLEQK